MLKFYSVDELVERRDATLFRSDDKEYQTYVISTFKLFAKKLTEGALLDCERLGREVEEVLRDPQRIRPSALLLNELRILFLEFYLKRKNRARFEEFYQLLRTTLRDLKPTDRELQLVKINSMVLYDPEFDVMPHEGQHTSVEAVRLYKQGHTHEAVVLLKQYLNEHQRWVCMKKVVLARWLLELSKVEAFEWLFEVLHATEHRDFEQYEARVLFVSGYRALSEKMGVDLSKCRLKNIHELYRNYEQELKKLNEQCSLKRIEEFKREYALGFDSRLSVVERKAHLSKALDMVATMPCYPSPSVYEFDCRVKLVQECIESGSFDECKSHVEIAIRQGNQLELFNWKREIKVSQALALVFEHQGNFADAEDLVERCMEIEPDRNKKIVFGDWKATLKSKSASKNNRTVELAVERLPQSKFKKKGAEELVGDGKRIHSKNNMSLSSDPNDQESPPPAQPPPTTNQANCCSLM